MKKMMLSIMAAAVIGATGTALAATPGQGCRRDAEPCYETSYAHCGGGYHGRGRGGYGCDGYGHRGGYGGGYCYDNENNEG